MNILSTIKIFNEGFIIRISMCSTSYIQPSKSHTKINTTTSSQKKKGENIFDHLKEL
jgi:hypothetical protein